MKTCLYGSAAIFSALVLSCPAFAQQSGTPAPPPLTAGTTQKAPLPGVSVDVSQMDTIKKFGVQADAIMREWYPKIVDILGSGPKNPPSQITVTFDLNYDGVAAAAGNKIVCSPKWFAAHPDDIGAIVHETAHVVQSYPKYNPVWLVEGIADYVRWFCFEPESKRPQPNPARATARDSYRTTGAFLFWVTNKYDKDAVKKLNTALREDTYTEDIWVRLTGKTLDVLNTEWIASLPKK